MERENEKDPENNNGTYIQGYMYWKMRKEFRYLLFLGFFFIFLALIIEVTPGYKCFFFQNSKRFLNFVEKHFEDDKLKVLYDLTVTINTILAAAVIFFYSVQDNRKEGIPHRRIMAYTFGSETVPTLFVVTMVLLPLNCLFLITSVKAAALIGIVFIYCLQFTIIVLILLATSHRYSIYAITRCEVRQYQLLLEIEERTDAMAESSSGPPSNSVQENVKYVWTYLVRHLDQVVESEEMTTDKLRLIRRLLRVPYYTKESVALRTAALCREQLYEVDQCCLKNNHYDKIYEFYYGNLLPAFSYLSAKKRLEERNMMYMLLYEFLEELDRIYVEAAGDADCPIDSFNSNYAVHYLMTVSGIMNSVMMSRSDNAEEFCNYVLNHCISDKKMIHYQILLYILFQEYLYRADSGAVRLKALEDIQKLPEWNWQKEDEQLCYRFWNVWMRWETVTPVNSAAAFRQAIHTLSGNRIESAAIYFIMCKAEQMRRRYTYESKNDTID